MSVDNDPGRSCAVLVGCNQVLRRPLVLLLHIGGRVVKVQLTVEGQKVNVANVVAAEQSGDNSRSKTEWVSETISVNLMKG